MSEQKVFSYEIGGKKYTQSPLKFIQIQQLTGFLKDFFFSGSTNSAALMFHLANGGMVPKFLAIVLTPEGQALKGKKVEDLADELMYEAGIDDSETILQVVEDFFVSSLDPSRSGRIKEAAEKMAEKLLGLMPSSKPSASSQEEISQKETTSSTDTALETPAPTSSTGEENLSSVSASSPSAQEEKE